MLTAREEDHEPEPLIGSMIEGLSGFVGGAFFGAVLALAIAFVVLSYWR